jgi:hypothetical protein
LRAGLSTTGAVIVLIACGVLGLLLVVGWGLRQIGHTIAVGVRFVARHLRAALTLPSEHETEAQRTPTEPAVLFDQNQFEPKPSVDLDLVAAEQEADEEEEYEEEEDGEE